MDFESAAKLSFYKTIEELNKDASVCLVKNSQTNSLYVKRVLPISNLELYKALKDNHIEGTPSVFEIFEDLDSNTITIIEEYISGMSLEKYILKNGKLDNSTSADFAIKLCDILNRLHSMKPQIIHRDITLSNIIVSGTKSITLIDFDASKFYEGKKSRDTVLMGTEAFAAPEQYGFGSSSPATDIWGVGMILNTMLTGKISSHDICPGKFNKIIKKCLSINPDDRYKSALALKTALKKAKNSFALPGFRTGSKLNKIAAIFIYALIIYLSVTTSTEGFSSKAEIFCFNIGTFIWLICQFFLLANYANIQDILPLCKSDKPLIKILGLIIWSCILFFLISLLMTFLLVVFA